MYEAVIFLICFVSACWALVITCVLLALLFSLFYAIREFDRFLHQVSAFAKPLTLYQNMNVLDDISNTPMIPTTMQNGWL